jgi:hypothetical protein
MSQMNITRSASSNIFSNVGVEQQYDGDNDRLFFVLLCVTTGLNNNNWGVSHRSMDVNIKTVINKPVIIHMRAR